MIIKVYDRTGSEFESVTLHIVHNSVYRAEHYHRGTYRDAHEFRGMHPVKAHTILTQDASPSYSLYSTHETD
jgi:hypothetical protein